MRVGAEFGRTVATLSDVKPQGEPIYFNEDATFQSKRN